MLRETAGQQPEHRGHRSERWEFVELDWTVHAYRPFSSRPFSISPTKPGAHTAIWMLLRWSTAPGASDALNSLLRRRLMVTSFIAKGGKKGEWKLGGDKGLKRQS
jgi:hypothetical protein